MKAQVGIEFVSIFFLVLLMFLFLQVNNSTYLDSISNRAAQVGALNLLEDTATLVNLVGHSTVFSAKFDLPPFLPGGYNYSFIVSNASMSISWSDSIGQRSVTKLLNIYNITNATSATRFVLSPGVHFVQRTVSSLVVS